MGKQRINVVIDADVYLKYKMSDINLSKTVSDLLRTYFDNDSFEFPDEVEIETAILNKKEELKNLQSDLSNLSVALIKVREDRDKEEKEADEKTDQMHKAIMDSGVLKDVI